MCPRSTGVVLYAGMRYDQENGLYGSYSAKLGKNINDSHNSYTFANNSPTTNATPSGQEAVPKYYNQIVTVSDEAWATFLNGIGTALKGLGMPNEWVSTLKGASFITFVAGETTNPLYNPWFKIFSLPFTFFSVKDGQTSFRAVDSVTAPSQFSVLVHELFHMWYDQMITNNQWGDTGWGRIEAAREEAVGYYIQNVINAATTAFNTLGNWIIPGKSRIENIIAMANALPGIIKDFYAATDKARTRPTVVGNDDYPPIYAEDLRKLQQFMGNWEAGTVKALEDALTDAMSDYINDSPPPMKPKECNPK